MSLPQLQVIFMSESDEDDSQTLIGCLVPRQPFSILLRGPQNSHTLLHVGEEDIGYALIGQSTLNSWRFSQ